MESNHTNRLIHETSPYLLQHAHNPVDWYAWGGEALSRAKKEDKPILLSIGYSSCHWCHVMESESFENEAIAQIMNERFINIKVDREERPDLDEIYMNAVQVMTGSGGWPMTVFLTPDLIPFHAGTYFPPEDRGGMPGFPKILVVVSDYYRSHRGEVDKMVAQVKNALSTGFLALGVWLFIEKTKLGAIIRAGTDDSETADALGINISRTFTLVFGMGAGLAGLAGVIAAPTQDVQPIMGMNFLTESFVVVIVGGMGSIGGSILAGLIIGELVTLGIIFWAPMSTTLIYIFMAIVLIVKPRGLMGRAAFFE